MIPAWFWLAFSVACVTGLAVWSYRDTRPPDDERDPDPPSRHHW